MLLMTLGLSAMGIGAVLASDTAEVTVYPTTRASALAGTAYTYQVRLSTLLGKGAPHETTEPYPGVGTDKTWAWEVVITYDPAVIDVTTDPYRDSATPTKDWFNFFHKYVWNTDFGEWEDLGPYGNFFAGVSDDTKGEVAATCTLTEDIPSMVLPVDDMGEKTFAQAGLHLGDKYDLPWSDNIKGAIYTFDYFILYNFKITPLVNIGPAPAPVAGTKLHISVASFFQYDKVTKYTVNAFDATIGTVVVPEFPLGLAPVIMLAPMIPILYIWRMRKKRVR